MLNQNVVSSYRATLVLLLWVTVEAWGQGYGEKIYANNRHAVVTIVTFDASGNVKGLGTGFITASTGEVVTNYHVVEGASFLTIKQLTGALFPVEGWLACSQAQDFAVLKVNGKELPTPSHPKDCFIRLWGTGKSNLYWQRRRTDGADSSG
ncbi:hypothetical protein HYR99_41405 [Candidatus Poribacteria bacterium]|nr:hypothetical protein [Candidatus Poribacteria bacterium]